MDKILSKLEDMERSKVSTYEEYLKIPCDTGDGSFLMAIFDDFVEMSAAGVVRLVESDARRLRDNLTHWLNAKP